MDERIQESVDKGRMVETLQFEYFAKCYKTDTDR